MSWTDWIKAFEDDIKEPVGVIMELGCGDGTASLFRFANKVVSLEILDNEENNWLGRTKIPEGANWKSEFFLADGNYEITPKIKSYLSSRLRKYKPDLVFVDCGIHCRGAIVQYLFNKVNIIVSHDTGQNNHEGRKDPYGWELVKPPENYTHKFYTGLGTTIWKYNQNMSGEKLNM